MIEGRALNILVIYDFGKCIRNGDKMVQNKSIVVQVFVISLVLTLLFVGTAMGEVSKDGLVAEWHFDEGSGTVLKDSSGNGNDGTIYGATWVEGKYEKALSFDGVDDYVEIQDSNSLDITDEITIEVLINANNLETTQAIFTKGMDAKTNYRLWIMENGNPHFGFGRHNYWTWSTADEIISKNDWHLLAYTYTSGDLNSLKMYIDGEKIPSDWGYNTFGPDLVSNEYPAIIGKFYRDDLSLDTRFFDGIIDEIRIYNRVLSDSEILENGINSLSDTKQSTEDSIEYVPSGKAAVFQEDFNAENIEGWWLGFSHDPRHLPPNPYLYGNWRIEDGEFIQDKGGDHIVSLIEGRSFTDQIIEAKIKIKPTSGYAGITVWYKDENNWVNVFIYPKMGKIWVRSNVQGSTNDELYQYTSSYNTWYDLKLDADSELGTIIVYVDGVKIFSHTVNSLYKEGSSGLNCGNQGAYFDDVEITSESTIESQTEDPTTSIPDSSDTSSQLDSDGDGWSDEKEHSLGTNPYSIDSDNDGLNDPEDPNPNAPEQKTPGFEAISAITGLLAVACLLRRGE